MQGYDSNFFLPLTHLIPSPKVCLHMCTHKAHFWTHMYFFTDSKNSKFNQILYNLRLRLLRACFATFFLQNLRKIIYKKICNTTFALFFSFEPQNEKEKKSHS